MALYSLVVEHGGKSYSTQDAADTVTVAVSEYSSRIYANIEYRHIGKEHERQQSTAL